MSSARIDRRTWFRGLFGGTAALGLAAAWDAKRTDAAQIGSKDKIKVTKIESFVLTNSWVFVKISTDAGITGWGEMLKDDRGLGPELPHPGARRQRAHESPGQADAAGRQRPSPPAHRTGARHHN